MKQNLIRIVEMGPWKHRVDDGLEARKTAYETMYTLVSGEIALLAIH
jgi:cullin-associated NEDD8-dissociated protein 1